MRELTFTQRKLLEDLIGETRRNGPPNYKRVVELTGLRAPMRLLHKLREGGYIRQINDAGSWLPLQTPAGRPLRLLLVDAGEGVASVNSAAVAAARRVCANYWPDGGAWPELRDTDNPEALGEAMNALLHALEDQT